MKSTLVLSCSLLLCVGACSLCKTEASSGPSESTRSSSVASRADSTAAKKTAVDAALVPSTPPEPEDPAPGPTHRVRFKSGESSAVVEGGVVRGERARYLLAASKGQKMRVSIKSMENNAVFSIVDATGKVVPGTEEGNDTMTWEGQLPASGDTSIVVGGTRGNASFTLRVEITSPGK